MTLIQPINGARMPGPEKLKVGLGLTMMMMKTVTEVTKIMFVPRGFSLNSGP